jgi:hypothetical protein
MIPHQPHSREELNEAQQSGLWRPSALAFFVLALAYSLVSERLAIGPPWLLLVLVIAASALNCVQRWCRLRGPRRLAASAMLVLQTAAVKAHA